MVCNFQENGWTVPDDAATDGGTKLRFNVDSSVSSSFGSIIERSSTSPQIDCKQSASDKRLCFYCIHILFEKKTR